MTESHFSQDNEALLSNAKSCFLALDGVSRSRLIVDLVGSRPSAEMADKVASLVPLCIDHCVSEGVDPHQLAKGIACIAERRNVVTENEIAAPEDRRSTEIVDEKRLRMDIWALFEDWLDGVIETIKSETSDVRELTAEDIAKRFKIGRSGARYILFKISSSC